METTIKEDFFNLFKEFGKEVGMDMKADAQNLAHYAGERAKTVANAYGKPEFNEVLQAERDNVFMRSAIFAMKESKTVQVHLKGLIQGALALASRYIAAEGVEKASNV